MFKDFYTNVMCTLNMFTLSIHMFALKFSYVYTRLYTHVSLKRKNLLKDILLHNLLHTFVLVNIIDIFVILDLFAFPDRLAILDIFAIFYSLFTLDNF